MFSCIRTDAGVNFWRIESTETIPDRHACEQDIYVVSRMVDLSWIMKLAVKKGVVSDDWFRVFGLVLVDSVCFLASPMLLFKQESPFSRVQIVSLVTITTIPMCDRSEWLTVRVSNGWIVPNHFIVGRLSKRDRYAFLQSSKNLKIGWESVQDLFHCVCRTSHVVVVYDGRSGAIILEKLPDKQVLDKKILFMIMDPGPGISLNADYLERHVPVFRYRDGNCLSPTTKLPYSTVVRSDRRDCIIGTHLNSSTGVFVDRVDVCSIAPICRRYMFAVHHLPPQDVVVGKDASCVVNFLQTTSTLQWLRLSPAVGEGGVATSLVVTVVDRRTAQVRLTWSNLCVTPNTTIAFAVETPHHSFQGVLSVQCADERENPVHNVQLAPCDDESVHRCWVKWFSVPEHTSNVLAFTCGCYETSFEHSWTLPEHDNVIFLNRETLAEIGSPECTITRRRTTSDGEDTKEHAVTARLGDFRCPVEYQKIYYLRGFDARYVVKPVRSLNLPGIGVQLFLREHTVGHTVLEDGAVIVTREHPGRVPNATIKLGVVVPEGFYWPWNREFEFTVTFHDHLGTSRIPEAMILTQPDRVYYHDEFPGMQFFDCSGARSKYWNNANRLFDFQKQLYDENSVKYKVMTVIHVTSTDAVCNIMNHGFGVSSKPKIGRLGGDAVYFDPLTPDAPAFRLFWNEPEHQFVKAVLICSVIVPDGAPMCTQGTLACEYGVGRLQCPSVADATSLYVLVFPSALGTHVMLRHVLLRGTS